MSRVDVFTGYLPLRAGVFSLPWQPLTSSGDCRSWAARAEASSLCVGGCGEADSVKGLGSSHLLRGERQEQPASVW